MHRPPNSLQGDTTDRINDEPWNKIILHQPPVRPTETSHYIRIYDKDTIKTEKMLVLLINTKYSVYEYEFYSQVHPRSHPRFTCIFVACPSALNWATKDAGKQGREHVKGPPNPSIHHLSLIRGHVTMAAGLAWYIRHLSQQPTISGSAWWTRGTAISGRTCYLSIKSCPYLPTTGPSPRWTCPEPQKHPDQMPRPPPLAPFNAKDNGSTLSSHWMSKLHTLSLRHSLPQHSDSMPPLSQKLHPTTCQCPTPPFIYFTLGFQHAFKMFAAID